MFFRLNCQEILELLNKLDEDELDSGDIILHIPHEHDKPISDCDSDYSDEESAGDLNKLGPGLLKTTCDFVSHLPSNSSNDDEEEEIVHSPKKRITNKQPSNSSNDVADEEIEHPVRKRLKKTNRPQDIEWTTNEPEFEIYKEKPTISPIPDEVMSCSTEYELFRLFLDDNFIDNLVDETNKYAVQNNKNLNVNRDEILVVFGGFLLSGYAKYPDKRLYWNRDSDTPEILRDAIRCRRFEDILHHMHFNDNTKIDAKDVCTNLDHSLIICKQNFSS